jgi:hypothetical protein
MGEAAKKERERREKVRQAGGAASATVGDDQLAANKGALANDTKQAPATAAAKRVRRISPRRAALRLRKPARTPRRIGAAASRRTARELRRRSAVTTRSIA